MPAYRVISEGSGFYTIKDLPVFEMHDNRGFPCDEEWMKEAIANHAQYKSGGWRPPMILGHNVRGQEKEAVGFLDNLVLKGRRLYADLVRVPGTIKEKLVKNAYPSRSVEILPKSKRILALALLGGTAPHFALPQMTYEESNEMSLWYRSPKMLELTDEQKTELYSEVGKAVGEALPVALEQIFAAGDGEEVITFIDEATDETYSLPVALLQKLGIAGAKGLGKAGAAATKVATRVAGGKFATQGAGRKVLGRAGKGLSAAGAAVARRPVAAGAGIAGAGVGAVGAAALRRKKKKYELEGVYFDEETGEVYQDGAPVGVIVTYDEMAEVGMDVPTVVKKPHGLPKVAGTTVVPSIDEGDVGLGSLEASGLEDDPGGPDTSLIEEVDREDSDQFEQAAATEIYQLRQEMNTMQTANALMQEGRKAVEYQKWLEDQRTAGCPVGDVEKAVEFMMTQSPEQIEEFKTMLLSQPKIALGRTELPMNFDNQDAAKVKLDYENNRETYQALGVTDADLKWAPFVRTEPRKQ